MDEAPESVTRNETQTTENVVPELTPEEARKAARRAQAIANLRPFVPGDPRFVKGPRKPVQDIRKAAQAHTADMVDVIRKIAENPKAPFAVRLKAANDVIAWGHGKQRTFKGGSGGKPVEVPQAAMDEANAFLEEMEQAAEEARRLNAGTLIEQPPAIAPYTPPEGGQGAAATARAAFHAGVIAGAAADPPDDPTQYDATAEEGDGGPDSGASDIDPFTAGIE